MAWLIPLAMLVALLVDRLFGEPPVWAHPVVGMGRYLGAFKRLPALGPLPAFIGGALAWLAGAAIVGAIALALEGTIVAALRPWASPLNLAAAAVVLGLMLKPLLAWRMLRDEVLAVETALARSLDDGRAQLSRLVSRDTAKLSAAEVREAAIETLAENLNDSVVAPLFWCAVAGLPGAAVYRFANTADAMWGYRDHREWSGKWAARADDLLSWIPARITAFAMLGLRPWLIAPLALQARRTPSPNSGWPMAAMALRLDLRLAKPGVYALNELGHAPAPVHVDDAARLAARTLAVCAAALMLFAAGMRLA